jgi:hypothetical protein
MKRRTVSGFGFDRNQSPLPVSIAEGDTSYFSTINFDPEAKMFVGP